MGHSITQLEREAAEIETAWDQMIRAGRSDDGQKRYGARYAAINAELAIARAFSAPAVVRLRFLAGEAGRQLDADCAAALGWRVDRDEWWNWHPGPVFDPPGDAWCVRKDGRNDVPCNEPLPHFTAESFERALKAQP